MPHKRIGHKVRTAAIRSGAKAGNPLKKLGAKAITAAAQYKHLRSRGMNSSHLPGYYWYVKGEIPITTQVDIDTIDPAVEPDLARFVNFLKLAGDPRAGLYNFSQYFCNSFRPCSCCHDDNFLQYFSNGTNQKPIGTANNNFIDQCISIKNGTFKGSNKAPSK